MSDALRFSLSPSISEIYDRIRPTSNIVEKGVIWLRDGRNPLALKISLVALSIVAAFGISTIGLYLVATATSPLLGKAIFFIPSFLGAGLSVSNTFLHRSVEKEKIRFCFESVQNVVGGPKAFSAILELDVDKLGEDFWGEEEGDAREKLIEKAFQKNGFLVLPRLLKPEHLTEPLMRGRDFMRRHFVSFKLLDKTDSSSVPFVLTLCETSRSSFQRFQCAHWVYVSSDKRSPDSFSLQQLHQIVTGNHPKYEFAR
jgi:hypothetical protein